MSDSEKLIKLTKSVRQMRNSQREFFKISDLYRNRKAGYDEFLKALTIAKDHEKRVDILLPSIYSDQKELF